ncbi:oligopeptide ABC transporter permease [Spiroplasma corruscae]|uniref:Oligopeptide ABC transporter permease n=1 Tax=Spiroplasma corruscae TaxID=216934 RepID=A0A222EP64_9MOLU|nr:oligopeptide ABC transporter permease OppC [Spiroplasma corruscae]ASP28191.1 oligopeptide ABC transporter permease [Spiroplasma corruscae]
MKFKYINKNFDISKIDKLLFKYIDNENEKKAEVIDSKPYSYWKSVFKSLFTKKIFMITLVIMIIYIIMTITVARGEVPVPSDKTTSRPASPSSEHWFGLGLLGEDLWNKIWIGSRTTLVFAAAISSIEIVVGIILGLIWGYFSKLDIIFIEIIRYISLIPSIVLWLLIILLFGGVATMPILILAISITSWMGIASVIRVQTILIRHAEYNVASKILGTRGFRIMFKNILPKILPIVVQTASYSIPGAIALDSTLTYYNFGFVKDLISEASLGSILNSALIDTTWQVYPHLLYIPIGIISGMSLLFFVTGKIISDSLDPKLHR